MRRKAMITEIDPHCGFYSDHNRFIGMVGEYDLEHIRQDGFYQGTFYFPNVVSIKGYGRKLDWTTNTLKVKFLE